jgi:hypothetical protein
MYDAYLKLVELREKAFAARWKAARARRLAARSPQGARTIRPTCGRAGKARVSHGAGHAGSGRDDPKRLKPVLEGVAMTKVNANSVFAQIVTIAKSNAPAPDLRRKAALRVEQFIADSGRSGHRPEFLNKHRTQLKDMLRTAATGKTLGPDEKAVFIEALEKLYLRDSIERESFAQHMPAT